MFKALLEYLKAKQVMAASGHHTVGLTLAEDIEVLANRWASAERRASLIDHVDRAFEEGE